MAVTAATCILYTVHVPLLIAKLGLIAFSAAITRVTIRPIITISITDHWVWQSTAVFNKEHVLTITSAALAAAWLRSLT